MALLEIRALRAWYGSVEAIHGIDMDVDEGCITAIIGSNGAGKTTIINAISGMIRRAGEITLAGESLLGSSNSIVGRGVVQVPEGRRVFAGLTVEENLMLGAYTVKDRREVPGLLDEQYALFPRLRERRNQDSGTLSGGEQQMLAIARALMSRPRLVMLDEPSLGLAPIIVGDVYENIQAICDKGVTVLLVEQNAKRSLGVCRRGYVIENGSVVLSGTGEELLNNSLVADAYLGASRSGAD